MILLNAFVKSQMENKYLEDKIKKYCIENNINFLLFTLEENEIYVSFGEDEKNNTKGTFKEFKELILKVMQ